MALYRLIRGIRTKLARYLWAQMMTMGFKFCHHKMFCQPTPDKFCWAESIQSNSIIIEKFKHILCLWRLSIPFLREQMKSMRQLYEETVVGLYFCHKIDSAYSVCFPCDISNIPLFQVDHLHQNNSYFVHCTFVLSLKRMKYLSPEKTNKHFTLWIIS